MAAAVGGGDGKKRPPRIDMTPMVDLGFLLLTFFVLTVQIDRPITMKIKVPAEQEENEPEPEEKDKIPRQRTLYLLVAGNNKLYYYQPIAEDSDEDQELNETNYKPTGLRKVITEYQKKAFDSPELKKQGFGPDKRQLITFVKMTDDATYQNMVDVLDELAITRQNLYFLDDIKHVEAEMVADVEKQQGIKDISVQETLNNLPEEEEKE